MPRWITTLLLALALGRGAESAQVGKEEGAQAASESISLPVRFPTWRVRQWKTSDGLPGTWIECVLQTSDGYLWLGTPDGLYRFDGSRFISLNHEACEAFESDVVKALAEDAEGALWVATKKGVLRVLEGTVRHFSAADGLAGEETTSVSVGRDGRVWVGTSGGISAFRDGVWKSWSDLPSRRPFAYCVLAGADGGVLIGTDTGLQRFDPETGRFSAIWEHPWSSEEPERGVVRCLMQDRSDRVWFGTDHSVFRYDHGKLESWPQGRPSMDNRVKCLFEDSANRIWAVVGFKLCRFENGEFVPVDREFGLDDAIVNGIGEDRGGNLWVATRYAGLACLRPSPVRVLTQTDGLPHSRIASVAPRRDGGVWIVTQEGVCAWQDGRLWKARQPEWKGLGAALRNVFEDERGRLWVTSGSRGFLPMNPMSEANTGGRRVALEASDIRAVHRDHPGYVWFACRGGLARWIPAQGTQDAEGGMQGEFWLFNDHSIFRTYLGAVAYWTRSPEGVWSYEDRDGREEYEPRRPPENDRPGWITETPSEGIPSFDFTAIAEDADGALWFGTEQGGLLRLRDWQVRWFTTDDGLASDRITALLVDSEGTLWVGTEAALSVLQGGRFVSVGGDCGFPADTVYQLLEDEAGDLWVGGQQGIYRLRRSQLLDPLRDDGGLFEVLRLDETDGLLSTEVHGKAQPGACRSDGGRLWFPTAQGVVVVDPALARAARQPFALTVTTARFAGMLGFDRDAYSAWKPAVTTELDARDSWTQASQVRSSGAGETVLPPGSGRYLEITYSALALTAPERVRFRYRLAGFDEEWIDADRRRVAYYTNLKPGTYRFEVMGGNRHGSWNESSLATLSFKILPRFTETRLFQALCGTGLVALIFGIHQVRVRVLRRIHRLQHETELASERGRIARDMHDDLGARLHEILLLSEASGQADPTPGRVGESAREAARSLEETVWAVQPAKDSLDQLIAFLVQRSREILESAGVRLELAIPESLPAWPLQGARRQNLFLICREALHNAVLHGRPNRVAISVEIHGARVSLSIRDDGRGFRLGAVEGCGNGLANMRHRAREAGATLAIDSAPGRGTSITLEWRQ